MTGRKNCTNRGKESSQYFRLNRKLNQGAIVYLALRRQRSRYKHQQFKLLLVYIVNSRPPWAE